MDPDATASSPGVWSRLSDDVTDLILSLLPSRSLARASAVCRHWRFLISDPSFSTRTRNPWLFLFGQNNVFLKQNQAFGFDPHSSTWLLLPHSPLHRDCFAGAGGLLLSPSSSSGFLYSPLLSRGPHQETSPLSSPRLNPLVARRLNPSRILVAGGARFIGGLVDIEDRLAVEIYDPSTSSWETCPPLPPQFPSNSHYLSSALILDRYFFVLGVFSAFVSAFDLETRSWSVPRVLRPEPEGAVFSFLIACGDDRLVLAGLCGDAGVRLWGVDWRRGWGVREIGAMPPDLMGRLFDDDGGGVDDGARFASLKCVGMDGFVYVFNEDRHRGYPACLCEIGEDWGCRWREVPPLPAPVNKFHKVVAFCSDVPPPSRAARRGPP